MIEGWLLFLISSMLLCSTLMLVQSHITNVIKLLIIQNILLTSYLLVEAVHQPGAEIFISLAITLMIKVIILPLLLWKLVRFLHLSGRVEPILNKPSLLLLAAGLVLLALIIGQQLSSSMLHDDLSGFSLGLANAFVAVLLIIFRRKTVTQVMGLLVLENSIFILAAAISTGFPWLIELGMSFDILMGLMIFTLFLMRIQQEHGSLEVKLVEKLKERA